MGPGWGLKRQVGFLAYKKTYNTKKLNKCLGIPGGII